MLVASLVSGKSDLSDWLFLIAAIVFAVVAIFYAAEKPVHIPGFLTSAALSLLAVGLLVI